MEFKWKANANTAYLHSPYRKKNVYLEHFLHDLPINYGDFNFIAEL